ncbi:hypothetical protein [Streptomyces sp. NPDC005435]|uniref:DUF7848 domain-containing protein n=1 Tax=Streptomyces sp. NPDC005435 TaxID=3154464 RepID=UPI0034570447
MTRAVYRFVEHSIRHEPAGGVVAQLFCMTFGCEESSGPQANAEDAQDWALRHTGLNPGHGLYRREFSDHARVTRADQDPGPLTKPNNTVSVPGSDASDRTSLVQG